MVCALQRHQQSVKPYPMGDVRRVVPSISSAVSAREAGDGKRVAVRENGGSQIVS